MIAADTNVIVDYLRGASNRGVMALEKCLWEGTVVLPEPVLFEILSGPSITPEVESTFSGLPRLVPLLGYWERAAVLRRKLLRTGKKARAMDCLVAQMCLDHRTPLITSDKDFIKFEEYKLILI